MKLLIQLYIALLLHTTLMAQTIQCKQNNTNNLVQKSIASQNFDVKYYRCIWENTPNVRYIKGTVSTTFKMITSGSSITFDLISSLTVDSVKYHGISQTFSRPTNGLLINFATSIAAGTLDSVTVYYQGAPPTTEGYFATGTHSGAPITYTLSEPYGARYWWPCKDDVGDKADSIEMILKYPTAFTGVANGVLLSETNDGITKTSLWKHRKPIVAYLVAFAISNYTKDVRTLTSNGIAMPFINYYYPESAATYNNSVASLTNAFNIFEQKFGAYPFNNELYMQTQIQQGVGGMEHQTNSFIDSWGAGLGAHELMHQWFGDKATCNTWKDIWLNEGFASYGEVVYTEATSGVNARINEMKNRALSINNSTTGTVYRYDTTTVGSIFNYRLSYLKGSYVLHMLRWQLGDAAYYQACKNYLNAPGISYGFATTDSLKKYMEQGLGTGANLTKFFNDWVYNQGYPTYNIKWNQVGNTVLVKADQTTSNSSVAFYEMPIPIRFVGATKDTTIVFKHSSSGQLFNTTIGFVVNSVEFDPEAWILTKNNFVVQDPSLSVTNVTNIIIDNNITLGPIPSKNSVTIYNKSTRIIKTILLQSITGSTLAQYSGNTTVINISKLAAGKYVVKLIDTNKKIIVKTLVKQ